MGARSAIMTAGVIPAKSERSYAHEFGRIVLVSITVRALTCAAGRLPGG
jgi:hypothetical protein